MKIGMLGGTFNPVHTGHVNLAAVCTAYAGLDKLIVVPAASAPHKPPADMPDDCHRLNMLRLAFEDVPKAHVSDLELARGGKSYTVDTLASLTELYPGSEIYLVVGSDMFFTLESWCRADEIKRLANVTTMPRESGEAERLVAECERLTALGWRAAVSPQRPYVASSTAVRAGDSGLVPPVVAEYIAQNGLYGFSADDYPWDFEAAEALARDKLSPKRFLHSKNVQEQAAELARRWEASVPLCRMAGMLHDICKETPRDEQLQLLSNSGRMANKTFMSMPRIWHGYAAAEYLKRELNIHSRPILDAVRFHTTARAGMSNVEEIIYLADLTSKERDYPGVDELRRLCLRSLREAMEFSLSYFRDNLETVCDETAKAFDYYLGSY